MRNCIALSCVLSITLSWNALVQCCSCPDVWVTFGRSCYYFGHGTGMSFVEAQHYCRIHNSYLVHVDNASENAFLKEYVSRMDKHYWMGLSDELIEGLYRWSDDGTSPEFTDWAPGQPDNHGNHEDCVMFWNSNGYLWIDIPCSYTGALQICEKLWVN